jgi:hypothetical protein
MMGGQGAAASLSWNQPHEQRDEKYGETQWPLRRFGRPGICAGYGLEPAYSNINLDRACL